MKSKIELKNYSIVLVICLITLNVIGIFAIGSVKESLQTKQIGGMILGIFIMVLISFFDYAFFLKFSWVIYFLNIVMKKIVFIL